MSPLAIAVFVLPILLVWLALYVAPRRMKKLRRWKRQRRYRDGWDD